MSAPGGLMLRGRVIRRLVVRTLAAAALLAMPTLGEAQVGSTPVRIVNTPLPVVVTNPSGGAGGPGVLGPTKPSDLVTIRSSGVKCGTSPWIMLDTRVNGDGTLSPFTIPGGQVLVVTSVDWRQGLTGGSFQQEEFFLFPSAANIGVNYNIVYSLAPGSSDSRAGTSIVVTGVAIKAGNPCWGMNNISHMGSADALVHGYLTADQ